LQVHSGLSFESHDGWHKINITLEECDWERLLAHSPNIANVDGGITLATKYLLMQDAVDRLIIAALAREKHITIEQAMQMMEELKALEPKLPEPVSV
jgi:hypothetical protein